jgi:hypothetical protein
VVSHGNAKSLLASGRIELLSSHHSFEPRHERFQLPQHTFPTSRALIGSSTTNEKGISEHLAQPLQRPAHGRLAQETSFRRACYVPFFQQRMERVQEIQIEIP